MLFSGFVREHATKRQSDALCVSAQTNINEYASFVSETWDYTTKSRRIVISENAATLPVSYDLEKSAYCKRTASEGKHQWTFEYTKIGNNHWNLIGIWNTSSSDPATERHFLNICHNGYAYCGPQGVLSNPEAPGNGGKKYGVQCQSGDVVEMTLDLDRRTLSFAVNGKDYGVGFSEIAEGEYRAAVTLYDAGDKIKLVSYRQPQEEKQTIE